MLRAAYQGIRLRVPLLHGTTAPVLCKLPFSGLHIATLPRIRLKLRWWSLLTHGLLGPHVGHNMSFLLGQGLNRPICTRSHESRGSPCLASCLALRPTQRAVLLGSTSTGM